MRVYPFGRTLARLVWRLSISSSSHLPGLSSFCPKTWLGVVFSFIPAAFLRFSLASPYFSDLAILVFYRFVLFGFVCLGFDSNCSWHAHNGNCVRFFFVFCVVLMQFRCLLLRYPSIAFLIYGPRSPNTVSLPADYALLHSKWFRFPIICYI